MYRNAYQQGLLTILFSGGANPLKIWETTRSNDGYVRKFLDQEIKSMVIEIGGYNVSTTYITCPLEKQVLGICLPFLVMIVKNMKKYFVFEITILDDSNTRRRFRAANFQSTTQINPLCTAMPISLADGWNQIQFNLSEFTRRAYNKTFIEVQKIKINANIRIRRIYFTDRLLTEEELPAEYKLFYPGTLKKKQAGKDDGLKKGSVEENKGQKEEIKVDSKTAVANIETTDKKEAETTTGEPEPVVTNQQQEQVVEENMEDVATEGDNNMDMEEKTSLAVEIGEEAELDINDKTEEELSQAGNTPLIDNEIGEEAEQNIKENNVSEEETAQTGDAPLVGEIQESNVQETSQIERTPSVNDETQQEPESNMTEKKSSKEEIASRAPSMDDKMEKETEPNIEEKTASNDEITQNGRTTPVDEGIEEQPEPNIVE